MIDADIIIPVAAFTLGTFHCSSVAIRTCAATTNARIRVLGNNTQEPWRSELSGLSTSLGCQWEYLSEHDGNLNMSKMYNDAMRKSKAKYICYCQADLIFYPHWLDNMIALWEQQPDYFLLAPYSFAHHKPVKPEAKIADIYPHASNSGVLAYKVADGYLYDERFAAWENDSDAYWYIKSKNLKYGLCLNSRVDHLGQAFFSQLEAHKSFDGHFLQQDKLSALLKQKWNLP